MTNYNRISSIDIMRGLTLVLMLFVNDLNMAVAPAWLGHSAAEARWNGSRRLGLSRIPLYCWYGYPFRIFKKILSRTVSL